MKMSTLQSIPDHDRSQQLIQSGIESSISSDVPSAARVVLTEAVSPEMDDQNTHTPPPTQLIVDRAPDRPVPVTTESHSMSLQWNSVSVTVQSNEIRVVEYLLTYELQMQQLDGYSCGPCLDVFNEERWSVQYLGPATYVQVKGLRPGRRYAVRVCCQPIVSDETVVVCLAKPSEVVVLETPATLPDAPLPPVLANRQRNQLKFKWSEPEETGGRPVQLYVLEMTPPPMGWESPPSSGGWYQMYSGMEKNWLVKRLQPGVQYTARVKCRTEMGESPFSQAMTCTTQASVPATPAAPVVTSSTENSVTLQWAAPLDNGSSIAGYQLEMDEGSGTGFVPIHHSPVTGFRVGNLHSGVVYKFRVRAENEVGRSMYSPVCEAVTAATVPCAPCPPSQLGASQSSVSISWDDVDFDGGSPVLGYEVEMQPKCKGAKKGMADGWLLVYQGSSKACTLAGLRGGCTYRVRACAFNARGIGRFGPAADVHTSPDVPEPPPSLAPSSRRQTGVTLAWAEPEHNGGSVVTSYRLEARLLGKLEATEEMLLSPVQHRAAGICTDQKFEVVYLGPETTAEVESLEPGCRYQFQVLAISKQGASPMSQVVTVDTRPGLPVTPKAPILSAVTAYSAAVSWKAPYGQGAPVTSYVLQFATLQAVRDAQKYGARGSNQSPKNCNMLTERGTDAHAHIDEDAELAEKLAEDGSGPDGNSRLSDFQPHEKQVSNGQAVATAADEDGGSCAAPQYNNACLDSIFQEVYHGPGLKCTVNNLQPDTEYTIRLKACNSVGFSPWNTTEFRSAKAPPSVPLGITVRERRSTGITVAWKQPCHEHGSSVTGYQVEYAALLRTSRLQAQWQVGYSGLEEFCTVNDLVAGKEYQVRVRASNACGWGPWTEPCTFNTTADVPGAPGAPTFSNRMGTSIRVKWQPPDEDHGAVVKDYVLEMQQQSLPFRAVYVGESTSYRVQQLAPGTQYSFRVRAANAVGSGPYSAASSVSTTRAPPEPPALLRVLPSGDAALPALSVSWDPANQGDLHAACISYEVDAALLAATPSNVMLGAREGPATKLAVPPVAAAVRQTCSAKLNKISLTGLQQGGTYVIRVRGIGVDGAGHGEWSKPQSITLPAAPAPAKAGEGSADEDSSVSDGRQSRRRKVRASGATIETLGKSNKAHLLGLKTATAKGAPRKTWLTPVSHGLHVPEKLLWRWMYIFICLLAIVVFALVLASS